MKKTECFCLFVCFPHLLNKVCGISSVFLKDTQVTRSYLRASHVCIKSGRIKQWREIIQFTAKKKNSFPENKLLEKKIIEAF